MVNCIYFGNCSFFKDQVPNMPDVAEKVKMIFCSHYYMQCAQYMVSASIGIKHVPSNLLPGDQRVAEEIILENINNPFSCNPSGKQ